jgi:hypothetical protein
MGVASTRFFEKKRGKKLLIPPGVVLVARLKPPGGTD